MRVASVWRDRAGTIDVERVAITYA